MLPQHQGCHCPFPCHPARTQGLPVLSTIELPLPSAVPGVSQPNEYFLEEGVNEAGSGAARSTGAGQELAQTPELRVALMLLQGAGLQDLGLPCCSGSKQSWVCVWGVMGPTCREMLAWGRTLAEASST